MKNTNIPTRTLQEAYNYINYFELGIMSVYERGTFKEQFTISGVHVFQNNLIDIGFTRTFADMIIPEQYVTDCQITDQGKVIISCGETEYCFKPEKSREGKKPCILDPKQTEIDTFMTYKYIDGDKIKTDKTKVYLPVSSYQVGTTNMKQETAIKKVIEKVLDGAQVKYQCCRVPAFSVEFNGDDFKIYGHIHDVFNEKPLNSVLLYDSEEDFTGVNPYDEFVRFAKIRIR